MGQPLAVSIARPGSEIAAGHLRKTDVEAGVPLPLGRAGLAVQVRFLDNRRAEAGRAGHGAVAALDTAVGDLGPARVVELQLESLAHADHRQRFAHPGPDRLDAVHRRTGLGVGGAPRRKFGHDGGPTRRSRLDDEALVDLGQEDVVAAVDFRPGSHRGAEARARADGALDGDDEGGGSPSPEVLVGELAAQEDPILDREGRELAGSNSQEGDRWSVRRGLLETNGVCSMSRRDRQVGREGETLPGRRPDGVAEDLIVCAALQSVPSGGLFVPPAGRQVGHRLDLVVDDGSFPDGRADDAPTGAADGLDQSAEILVGEEPLPGRGRLALRGAGDHGSGNLLGRGLRHGLGTTVSERTDREAAAAWT